VKTSQTTIFISPIDVEISTFTQVHSLFNNSPHIIFVQNNLLLNCSNYILEKNGSYPEHHIMRLGHVIRFFLFRPFLVAGTGAFGLF
jgi:hypothetical protein